MAARLDAAVKKAVMPASFADRLNQAGIERNYRDSAQFAQYIQAEYAQWREFIQANLIRVDWGGGTPRCHAALSHPPGAP